MNIIRSGRFLSNFDYPKYKFDNKNPLYILFQMFEIYKVHWPQPVTGRDIGHFHTHDLGIQLWISVRRLKYQQSQGNDSLQFGLHC